MNIIYRGYEKDDEISLVELLDLVFDAGPWKDLDCSHLDHWRWRYEDNPLGEPIVSIAELDGKIIGCSHAMIRELKLGEKIYLHTSGGDAAVHPKYRGQGIYNRLKRQLKVIEEDLGIYYHTAISTNPIIMARNIRHKVPRFPHHFVGLVKTSKLKKHLGYMRNTRGKYLVEKIAHAQYSGNIKVPKQNFVHIDKIQEFDSNFNKLWDQVAPGYDRIVKKTSEYLNWRYADPRGGQYEIFAVTDDSEALGFIVLRIRRPPFVSAPEGYLVEIVTHQDDDCTAKLLFSHAVKIFKENGIDTIHYWGILGNSHTELLKKMGFARTKDFMIVYRKYLPEGLLQLETTSPKRIHMVQGDFDHI
jgi:GNAT superfamily N-acetyltransferase